MFRRYLLRVRSVDVGVKKIVCSSMIYRAQGEKVQRKFAVRGEKRGRRNGASSSRKGDIRYHRAGRETKI